MESLVLATFAFAAGCGCGAILVGARYVRALEQLRDIAPTARGQVYAPGLAVPGEELEPPFDQATIDRGARAIQEELQGQGRSIPWDEAQAQARAMLAETLPVLR